MPTSQSEGSQTAVISTEHTLATITAAGTYVRDGNTLTDDRSIPLFICNK